MDEARDPELQNRITEMMASEIEKIVAISSRSFNVLEEPTVPVMPDFPKKKIIVGAAIFFGFVVACLWVVIKDWAVPIFKAGRGQ
jgi:uncharacterized protein involved in exopolysaccharide biosynthesis